MPTCYDAQAPYDSSRLWIERSFTLKTMELGLRRSLYPKAKASRGWMSYFSNLWKAEPSGKP